MTSVIDDEYFTEIDNEVNSNIKVDYTNDKNYPIRCSVCYEIAILKSADFRNNIYVTECYNSHIISYNSYDSFIESTCQILDKILCHNCQKSNEKENQFFRCNDCFLFLCNECKSNHEKEANHSSFVKLNTLDSIIYPNKKMPDLNDIEKECSMIEQNLSKIQDIEKNFDLLLKEFENFKNHFIQTLFNYCLTQKKLVNYLKNNFNKNNDNCNYQAFTNYEIFHNNNSLINEYIQKINYSFNRSFVEKGEIESNIKIFIKLIENFKSKKISF